MSVRRGARPLALTLTLGALVAAPTAHAEKVVTQDAVGDVVRITIADGSDDMVTAPAPEETATDIVRTVVAHGNARLSIAIHVRDLPSSKGEAYVQMATPRATYDISATKSAGSRAKVSLSRKNGTAVTCRGLRAAFDSRADVVAISLPAVCVESPRWVRVGTGLAMVDASPTSTDPEVLGVFVDDGHRDGTVRDRGVDKGPRVRRG